MTSMINSIQQLLRSDGINPVTGLFRYAEWQIMKFGKRMPAKIFLSKSKLISYTGSGCAPLIYWMNEYDYNNMGFLIQITKIEGGMFVDIGANIGAYSLIASEAEQIFVVSVEPNPNTYKQLQENIAFNERDNIFCLNWAISDHNGKLFITDEKENTINQVLQSPILGKGSFQVDCFTLDYMLERFHQTITYLKIDIEGHEVIALGGAKKALQSTQVIQIENGTNQEIKKILTSANFHGPFYAHYKSHILNNFPQNRPEDPIYISNGFIRTLEKNGWRVII